MEHRFCHQTLPGHGAAHRGGPTISGKIAASILGNLVSFCLLVSLLVLFAGCKITTKPSRVAGGSTDFAEINLFMMPTGVNLDAMAGPDAVAIQFFAVCAGKAKGSRIMDGKIEVLLLDGYRKPGSDEIIPTLQTWEYSAKELNDYSKESLIGVGYEMLLVWDEDKQPTQKKVTVLVRYTDPNEHVLYSDPGVVALSQ